MNQEMQVSIELKKGRKLTSLDARDELGILDYPKRISNLRAMGVAIKDRWKRVKKRTGGYTRVKEYYL